MLSTIEQRHAARELQGKVASDTRAALDRAIADELASGAELVSRAGTNALLVKGKKVTLTALHLVLSVLTAGLWLIIWVFLVATNHPQRVVLSVDEQGRVDRSVTTASWKPLARKRPVIDTE